MTSILEAATLADFILTHKGGRGIRSFGEWSGSSAADMHFSRTFSSWFDPRVDYAATDSEMVCNFCHKKGHWKKNCWLLKTEDWGSRGKSVATAAHLRLSDLEKPRY